MDLCKLSNNLFYQIYVKLDEKSQNNLLGAGEHSHFIIGFKKRLVFFTELSQFILRHYDLVNSVDLLDFLFSEKKVLGLGEMHSSCDHRFLNATLIGLIWDKKFRLRIEGGKASLELEKEEIMGQLSYLAQEIAETALTWDLESLEEIYEPFLAERRMIAISQCFFSIFSTEAYTVKQLVRFLGHAYDIDRDFYEYAIQCVHNSMFKEKSIKSRIEEKLSAVEYHALVIICVDWMVRVMQKTSQTIFGLSVRRNESLCRTVSSDYEDDFSSVFVAGSNHVTNDSNREFFQKKKILHMLLVPKEGVILLNQESSIQKNQIEKLGSQDVNTINEKKEEDPYELFEAIRKLPFEAIDQLKDTMAIEQCRVCLTSFLEKCCVETINLNDNHFSPYSRLVLSLFGLELKLQTKK